MLTPIDRLVRSAIPTPRMLRRLRAGLLVAVVVVLAGGLSTFLGAHAATDAVNDDVVPTTAAVSAIWTQLQDVDAKLSGCTTDPGTGGGKVHCAGVLASGEHHGIVADAVQRLAVLADKDIGDVADRQLLQVVQGLLIRYLGLVEQAHLSLSRGQTLLAEAYLGYASELLRSSALRELNEYRAAVGAELADQRESIWRKPVAALLWLIPLVIAVGLLIVSQAYLVARFRRWLNWPLALATAGVLALGAGAAQPMLAGERFGRTAVALGELVAAPPTEASVPKAPDAGLAAAARDAANSYYVEYLMPLIAVAVIALIMVGFQRRLDEYKSGSP